MDGSAPSTLGAGASPGHTGECRRGSFSPRVDAQHRDPNPAGDSSQLVAIAQGVPQLPEAWGTSVTNGPLHPGPRRPDDWAAAFQQQSASTEQPQGNTVVWVLAAICVPGLAWGGGDGVCVCFSLGPSLP